MRRNGPKILTTRTYLYDVENAMSTDISSNISLLMPRERSKYMKKEIQKMALPKWLVDAIQLPRK
jgi:hypothetical protein